MRKKILVTGASGFVGQLLCQDLMGLGYEVHALTRQESHSLPSGVQSIFYTNLIDLEKFRKCFKECFAVIHLAAKVHVKDDKNIEEYRHVNRDGTVHLANIAESEGVKRFIYLSTIKVNGDKTVSKPYDVMSRVAPVDAYAVSKWEAEQALMRLHENTDMDVTILRPVLMYGPNVKGNLNTLMRIISKRIPLPFAKTANFRSLLNVRNLNALICECLVNSKAIGQTFLVADGVDISTSTLIEKIALSFGKSSRLFYVPNLLMKFAARIIGKLDIYDRLFGSLQVNTNEMKKVLNWEPPYTIEDGMDEMTRAFQKSRSK